MGIDAVKFDFLKSKPDYKKIWSGIVGERSEYKTLPIGRFDLFFQKLVGNVVVGKRSELDGENLIFDPTKLFSNFCIGMGGGDILWFGSLFKPETRVYVLPETAKFAIFKTENVDEFRVLCNEKDGSDVLWTFKKQTG